MNRLISLLPVVLVVALVGYILGTSVPAQSFTATNTPAGWQIDPLPHGQSIAHPRDWVIIREQDGPYTVPAGKILALTALGDQTGMDDGIYLTIDGVQEVKRVPYEPIGAGLVISATVHALPTGLSAGPGSVVAVSSTFTRGRAWGYLVDA